MFHPTQNSEKAYKPGIGQEPTPVGNWVNDLFPFFVHVDEELTILDVGRSMSKLLTYNPEGMNLASLFHMVRPKGKVTFERMARSRKALFVAKLVESEIEVRGQFFNSKNSIYLLGSPRFGSVAELNASPVSTADYAATDQSVELMIMKVSNERQVRQLRDMAVQLHESALREKVLAGIEKALEHDLNNAADIRIRLDSQLAIVDISVVKDDLLPWDEKEIIGRPVSQVFSRFPHALIKQECKGESPLAVEFGQKLDQREFEFDARVTKSLDGGFLVLIHDKTEKVRAQKENEELQRQLQKAARNAGMAEVATGVLHNVGNVLNSINVSANLIQQRFLKSSIKPLVKAAAIVEAKKDSAGEFFTTDPQGKHFPELFIQIATDLDEVQYFIADEVRQLRKNIDHVKRIISVQQSLVKRTELIETVDASHLFEDALQVELASLAVERFEVLKNYERVPEIRTSRHDVVQILINLIRNARQAYVEEENVKAKWIRLSLTRCGDHLKFAVTDNGEGIEPDLLVEIFRHGYTTKSQGNGFGLHCSANTAQVLGGTLEAASSGAGTGATFTLTLPLRSPTS